MRRKRTTVVNMRIESCDVRIDRQSIFGNPFKISSPIKGRVYVLGALKSRTREESIACYQVYFDKRIIEDEEFRERVEALAGLKLGCWCKPLACHGDIIAAWLNEQEV